MKRVLSILLATAMLSLSTSYGSDSALYPDNLRRWVHMQTRVLMPGANPQLKSEEGMHHIFANENAAQGYSSGNFPDGSIIVYELREAKQQSNGVISEENRKRVDVMVKDSSFKETGGW